MTSREGPLVTFWASGLSGLFPNFQADFLENHEVFNPQTLTANYKHNEL